MTFGGLTNRISTQSMNKQLNTQMGQVFRNASAFVFPPLQPSKLDLSKIQKKFTN